MCICGGEYQAARRWKLSCQFDTGCTVHLNVEQYDVRQLFTDTLHSHAWFTICFQHYTSTAFTISFYDIQCNRLVIYGYYFHVVSSSFISSRTRNIPSFPCSMSKRWCRDTIIQACDGSSLYPFFRNFSLHGRMSSSLLQNIVYQPVG